MVQFLLKSNNRLREKQKEIEIVKMIISEQYNYE